MSERVYLFLLRLYPSQFRSAYGDEVVQLVRDRVRDERSLRLWMDLLMDLACSLPRLHLRPAPGGPRAIGPAFLLLEGERPRAESLFLGGVVSLLLILASFSNLPMLGSRPAGHAWPRTVMQAAPQAPSPQMASADRHRVVEAVAAKVRQHYFDKQAARRTAEALLAHERAGDYNAAADGQALANLLARHLVEASGDKHFTMEYTPNVFPDFSKPPVAEFDERYRTAMERANCTFEKVEIRANNIGYVKLNSFPQLAVCQAKAESAMRSVNRADAVIFDLRENRGGYADMVVFLASYLFDHPEYMFNPGGPVTEQSWTRSPVAGSLLADKPVYILTSSRTYSGAEQFSYDLKMLKRATVVGETTGGAAHANVLRNAGEHFAVGIPEHRPVNPFADLDWAVTGVEPDVKVRAVEALGAAERLAGGRVRSGAARFGTGVDGLPRVISPRLGV